MKVASTILLTRLIFITLLLSITACGNSDVPPEFQLSCDDTALFSREGAQGRMLYLSCYDSWSIKLEETNEEGSHLIGASLDLPSAFKIDSLPVIIDACFHEFDLELLFPDPVLFGEMYVIKDYNISATE